MGTTNGQMMKQYAICLLLTLPYVTCLTPVKPLTKWIVGVANHFGAPKDHPIDPLNPVIRMGGCSYGELDPRAYPYYNVIAIHPNSELLKGLKTHGCGACFEVQCIDGEADRCVNAPQTNNIVVVNSGACSAGCGGSSNTVNLHTFAFDKIAAIKYGNVRIRIRQVECEPFGLVEVKVKDYRPDKGGYMKITVRNVPGTGGLEKLELRGKANRITSTTWKTFDNHFGAAFEMSNLPQPPFNLRLTVTINAKKQQLVLRQIIKKSGFTGVAETNGTFTGVNPFPKTRGQSRRFPTTSGRAAPPTTRGLPSVPKSTPPTLPVTPGSTKPDVDPDELDDFVILVDSDDGDD